MAFFFLLVREVGDVRWVPLLCVWKIDPKILSFFLLARLSRLAAGRPIKKTLCPPHGLVRIDAHVRKHIQISSQFRKLLMLKV